MGLETVNTSYGHCTGAVEAPFDVSTGFYDFGMSQIYYRMCQYIYFTVGQNLIVSLKCALPSYTACTNTLVPHPNTKINSSPPGQNGRHFTDDIFRCVFVTEKFCILIKISLKFVPRGPNDNNPALVKIMAWRGIGDKPLSEPMLNQFIDAYMWH